METCGNMMDVWKRKETRGDSGLLTSRSFIDHIRRFDHHIVMREEIKEDRRRQRAEAKLEAARREGEAAATEERKK